MSVSSRITWQQPVLAAACPKFDLIHFTYICLAHIVAMCCIIKENVVVIIATLTTTAINNKGSR